MSSNPPSEARLPAQSASPAAPPTPKRGGLLPGVDWHRVAIGGAVVATWVALLLFAVATLLWS